MISNNKDLNKNCG